MWQYLLLGTTIQNPYPQVRKHMIQDAYQQLHLICIMIKNPHHSSALKWFKNQTSQEHMQNSKAQSALAHKILSKYMITWA